jgi:pimeloyl-ACP methyl ester carboxylesterase
MSSIRYRRAEVDGFKIFFREAGRVGAPKLLLLHGFPSAGFRSRARPRAPAVNHRKRIFSLYINRTHS